MTIDLTSTKLGKAEFYDKMYQQENYFLHRQWLYAPYISSMIAFCGLPKGASILDVGCGQGFFSYLFNKNGMKVLGIDISDTGISKAQKLYGNLGLCFDVSDIRTASFAEQFDCIFVRSCSLYNTNEFSRHGEPTARILKHLKPGGTFIFVYNSKVCSKPSPTWRYHSIDDARSHFRTHNGARLFFVTKPSAYLLRRYTFSRAITRLNILLSRVTGVGGDIVCILKKDVIPVQ